MSINIFSHPYKDEVNTKLAPIAKSLGYGDSITAFHTPFVLPLPNSNQMGGYARSLGLHLGPKWIALNCDLFSQEGPSMQEFILGRQVALFNKPSRYLHMPLAATVIAIGYIASSILFPSSVLAVIGISTIIAAITANFIAKREQENEKYADLIAFRNLKDPCKQNILKYFKSKLEEETNTPVSLMKNTFSSYPSYAERYNQLVYDDRNSAELKFWLNSIKAIKR